MSRYYGASKRLVLTKFTGKVCKEEDSDVIKFDSQLEATFYQKLLTLFSAEQIKIHEAVLLIPKTEFHAERSLNIDFVVSVGFKKKLYIEIKGVWSHEWESKLMLLADNNPEVFTHLWIGVCNPKKTKPRCKKVFNSEVAERIFYARSIGVLANAVHF
ncbi:hypothetical protein [Gloeothece verrucosa]|uniref:Uncharacterized protein n=1 Tax=Gloeothece verrucosa (strain PCC 7822) TaxID=497965 RepID=E0UHR0_GLOV7|nr:hypothetical protein [Gloeothece verrucosa]ADN13317.1 hypothetical protein Cyan7822_1316 [Gloeothece verrucosa PCC 7822]